ncbi:hypothetical protein G7050_03510 [Dysgonomonas sp. HDW5A]|uniref:hypothetical protein n=1 Tax=Dysgonomonas sp. HDW5A TaxID=2714926 RepID=UPI001409DACA|nr:hypothetical protein [Dysgonomonas sp. HDW5A]QIK58957.1 hypothetical protein G7050_03510 [Dysgonomonas sp. HDW5A]
MQPKGKNNQILLKALLAIQTLVLLIYTIIVNLNDGGNFAKVFFENVVSINWNGQFSLDFHCYLLLSMLWIMWRNRFSISSIIMGIAANILGIIVFAPYLIYLITKEKGDLKKVLVGDR